MKKRIIIIDFMKTLALIGVLLFHTGALDNGYLGVEIFFVISGYLFAKKNRTAFSDGTFQPIKFLMKKVSDFWPLLLAAGLLCLAVGYISMLPDDYENLAESVVAASLFANNVLLAITTKNYWAVGNTYKPLMHTWYIGVLLQMYVFLAFILWGVRKVCKKDRSAAVFSVVGAFSLLLYLLPVFSTAQKFFFFPFRLFELCAGCMTAYLPSVGAHKNGEKKAASFVGWLSSAALCAVLFCQLSIPTAVGVIFTVAAACAVLCSRIDITESTRLGAWCCRVLSVPGRYSYDAYIWHQVIIAFAYYFFFQKLSFGLAATVILLTALLSALSVFIRSKETTFRRQKPRLVLCAAAAVLLCAASLLIYSRAGVVRDVPELGISVGDVHRNMHGEYNESVAALDRDFEDENKIHVFLMGDSFAKDFTNVIRESAIADRVELSYFYGTDASVRMSRISQADVIIYATNTWEVSAWATDNIDPDKLYVVGRKMYGNSNGIIYRHRNSARYFEQRVELSEDFIANNDRLREIYGDHYIDMIGPLMVGNEIAVFTDDHFYISQDCKHLTQSGAKYYARILDLSFITNGQ